MLKSAVDHNNDNYGIDIACRHECLMPTDGTWDPPPSRKDARSAGLALYKRIASSMNLSCTDGSSYSLRSSTGEKWTALYSLFMSGGMTSMIMT